MERGSNESCRDREMAAALRGGGGIPAVMSGVHVVSHLPSNTSSCDSCFAKRRSQLMHMTPGRRAVPSRNH